MADIVEEVMQDMVPELDDLRRKRLFNDDELRQIVKRRRDFEYGLQKSELRQQDFLGYIKYEVALDCLRKRRSRALRWKKISLCDVAGVRRCHRIFDRATGKFKGDKRMWYQHVDFCLRTGSTKVLSGVLTKALRLHPREVHFWLLAADRELKMGHIKAARALIVRGLRFAPKSPKLWGEFLRLEVRVALHVRLAKSLNKDEEGAAAPEPPQDRWAAVRLIVRRALGNLATSPSGTAAFLRQAVECLKEVSEAPQASDGTEDFAKDVSAALAAKRPGVMEGKEWSEASEEASVALWELWWDHALEKGEDWPTIAKAVGASAPPAVLRRLAEDLAAIARRGAAGDGDDAAVAPGGGAAAAASALAQLVEAPSASGDAETALALLEALEKCTEPESDAPDAGKAAAKKAAKRLLQRAAAAHPKSGRLLLLSAAAQDGGAAPRGLAAAPAARAARGCGEEEAAGLLLLAAAPEAGAAEAPSAERRRLLEAMLRHLAPEASPAPVVAAHVAAAFARGGADAARAACDEARDAATAALWDRPARRAAALAAALDCELRAAPAAVLAAGRGGLRELGKRLTARFEELLGCLSDDDPDKEDWWVRYMEFAWRASHWHLEGRRSGGGAGSSTVPSATDLHMRAMRSVANQARYAEKAAAFLRLQGGGAS